MVRMRSAIVFCVAVLATTAPASAQDDDWTAKKWGRQLLMIADSTRVALDLLKEAEQGERIELTDLAGSRLVLDRHLTPLRAAGKAMAGDVGPISGVRLNRSAQSSFILPATAQAHLDSVKAAWRDLFPTLQQAVGRDRTLQLDRPMEETEDHQLEVKIRQNLGVLARYERKFGEGSAQLNLVESVANYLLGRACPAFGVRDDGPGPMELVASYSSAYLRVGEEGEVVQSVLELGLRRYIFADGWGESAWKPSYVAGGLLVTGEKPGPLEDPFRDERLGAYLSWGSIKAAVVFGDEGEEEWLLSREWKFVPGLF